MHLRQATIRNFRMHVETRISFDRSTTVIVGRNNSGKTSVAELFRRFLGDRARRSDAAFTLDDFSSSAHGALLLAARSGAKGNAPRTEPPAIELELAISYADQPDELGAVSDLIVDLEDACTETHVLLRYSRSSKEAGERFYDELPEPDDEALDALDKRLKAAFAVTVTAIDPSDEENRAERPLSTLLDCVQLGFVDAARPMAGDRAREPDTLGRLLAALFDANRKEDENGPAAAIEAGVAEAERQINAIFGVSMKGRILPSFAPLGYPLLSDGELETRTTFDSRTLLRQNTRLYYGASRPGDGSRALPEGHNGLGLRNLIYILLQLHAFHEVRRAAPVPPPVSVLFLEEPEAHLHPQLEEVFVRKVMEVHDRLCGDDRWALQIVVTTHSSHIANEVPFEQVRYFQRSASAKRRQWVSVVKDLGEFTADAAVKAWLTQYLTLTRCDLFFADKAILVEGAAERLLLPALLRRADSGGDTTAPPLTAQYLTMVEVGGRHAHKFYPFLEFIEVPALIITDLDAEALQPSKKDPEKMTMQRSLVSRGERSGNPCLSDWFGDSELTGLLAQASSSKVRGETAPMRIAYQVPEEGSDACGRSFEEALILANPTRWPVPDDVGESTYEREDWADGMAKAAGKTSLALDLIEAVADADFTVPRYIREGLQWLRTVSERAGDARVVVGARPVSENEADLAVGGAGG